MIDEVKNNNIISELSSGAIPESKQEATKISSSDTALKQKQEEVEELKSGINYRISSFIDRHRVAVGAAIIGFCAAIGAVFGGVGALPGAGAGAGVAGFALGASRETMKRVEGLEKDIVALSGDKSMAPEKQKSQEQQASASKSVAKSIDQNQEEKTPSSDKNSPATVAHKPAAKVFDEGRQLTRNSRA